MNLCVIGTGYVGLVGAAIFAERGNSVVGVDIDKAKLDKIAQGIMPIFEPGLSEIVLDNMKAKRLSFTTSIKKGIEDAEIVMICVGTPQSDTGAADLGAVWTVAEEIGKSLNGYKVIVTKSTVPVGTNEHVEKIIKDFAPKGMKFDVASNPEFLREGYSVDDMRNPDRTVVGSNSAKALGILRRLYSDLKTPIVESNLRTAEMIKYASNAFLATKISFTNEMAQLCERANADVTMVAKGMGLDSRIGPRFLNASVGYGGSCFKPGTLVYVKNSPNLKNVPIEKLVSKENEHKKVNSLGFNLQTRKAAVSSVSALTQRDYNGDMVKINTRMGRNVDVTADHPMLVFNRGIFDVVLAKDLKENDLLPFSSTLPTFELAEQKLNLIELIAQNSDLTAKVIMEPTKGYMPFASLYSELKPYAQKYLKYTHDIKRYNKLPLRVFLILPKELQNKIDLRKMTLYTQSATKVPAIVPVDGKFLRYIGYYLAEGCISCDFGRAGAIRKRIGITFHEDEKDYIADIKNYYAENKIKYLTKKDKKDHNCSLLVSSKIWAYLLEEHLHLGVNSYTKKLPLFTFRLPAEYKLELLRGLFSGDGGLSVSFDKYPYIEYGTVSVSMANDVTVLLQSLGVVSSRNDHFMTKSTVRARIIRITGKIQLEKVSLLLGDAKRKKLMNLLQNVKYIEPIGYKHLENFNLIPVQSVNNYHYEGPVFSLETSDSTVMVNTGLIVHNCFPKDVAALYKTSTDQAYDFKLLRAVMEVNETQKFTFFKKITKHLGENLTGKTVAVLGLAFKDNTDDIRESVAIKLVRMLRGNGAAIRVFDPAAMENTQRILGDDGIYYATDKYDAVKGADALCVLTEWAEFKELDMPKVKKLMKGVSVFDGRILLNQKAVEDAGFVYFTIGKRSNGWTDDGDIVTTAVLKNGNGK